MMGSLATDASWVLLLPLIAALTSAEELGFQSNPFILWIFLTLDSYTARLEPLFCLFRHHAVKVAWAVWPQGRLMETPVSVWHFLIRFNTVLCCFQVLKASELLAD